MPVQKITIEEFLSLAKTHPVLDVRSPGEYTHAHIPGANSFPLFSDEERKQVGTTYKQQSRETAIKLGLDFFGPKMKNFIEEAEKIYDVRRTMYENSMEEEFSVNRTSNISPRTLLIHCWRGGMRSAAIAWLLDMYGFKVYTLVGGYKAYRKWVLDQFEKSYRLNVIGGNTGSGKTLVLHELKRQNYPVIDLEQLANHKGSAFGALGLPPQPTQEMFENLLAERLSTFNFELSTPVFVEDESQRIGDVNIPIVFWKQMRNTQVYYLDIPFEERLEYIVKDYGSFDKEKLVNAIIRIQKRLGGLETKTAINHLLKNNIIECFRILLTYYDKWYQKGLNNRENLASQLNKIPCLSVDTAENTKNLVSCALKPVLQH